MEVTPSVDSAFSPFHLLKVTRMRQDTVPNLRFRAVTTDTRSGNLERPSINSFLTQEGRKGKYSERPGPPLKRGLPLSSG